MNINADVIEVYSEPGPTGYGRVARIRREGRVVSVTLPNLAFDASEALPPEERSAKGRRTDDENDR